MPGQHETVGSVAGLDHLEPLGLEELTDEQTDLRLVVHHEHPPPNHRTI